MRTPSPRFAWLATLILILGLSAATASLGDDDRLQTPIEVQEWSIWVGTPTQTSINTARGYRNAMPGPVGTSRPKIDETNQPSRFPIAPVSIVQFFGEPTRDVDIELGSRRAPSSPTGPRPRTEAGGSSGSRPT